MQLVRGDRVAIIGGGPAGSFAALNLLQLSVEARLDLEVLIFEARDFNQPGPGGCNKCAGILSSTFLSNLEAFGLHLPVEIIQAEMEAYILYLGQRQVAIRPPEPGRTILSVYRGSGPRLGQQPYPASFDGWLLEQAHQRGAVVQHQRVKSIQPGAPSGAPLGAPSGGPSGTPSARPRVVTASGEIEAGLVVVATGINSRTPLDPAWGYRPPGLEKMAQGEILNPGAGFEHNIHIFFDQPAGLVFGGVTPKGRYANISLLGKDLPRTALAQFLDRPEITVPPGNELPIATLCNCQPMIAVTPAANYFADRMVVVGDAAVTRLYKDGIGTAFTTARAAMHTALKQGISRRSFARGYHPVCQKIARDNRFGLALFQLWALSHRSPFLLNAWQQAILWDLQLPAHQRVHERMMWGIFTGDETYRQILSRLLSWPALRSFAVGMLKTWSKP